MTVGSLFMSDFICYLGIIARNLFPFPIFILPTWNEMPTFYSNAIYL